MPVYPVSYFFADDGGVVSVCFVEEEASGVASVECRSACFCLVYGIVRAFSSFRKAIVSCEKRVCVFNEFFECGEWLCRFAWYPVCDVIFLVF